MDLPQSAGIVVIGGGINGASIAYYLALAGIREIVVIEAVKTGHGASSRGAGIIRTYHSHDDEARLAIASLATFRNWKDEIGGTAGYNPNGFLWMVGPERVHELAAIVARQNLLGASSEILRPEALIQLQPLIDPKGIAAAAYEPLGGCGSPVRATASLHAAAKRLGARVIEGVTALSIVASGGRVRAVSTTAGTISTPLVILAAGAWTVPLAASAGIALPLVPTRMTTGKVRHEPLREHLCTFIDTVTDTFFRPDAQGVAHISIRDRRHNTKLDPSEDWVRETVEESASLQGIDRLRKRMPALMATPLAAWVGPDGVTPDKRAIYGPVASLDGLILCVGGNYKGFKVAPAVGRLIAELVTTGRSPTELAAFALDRFGDRPQIDGPGRYSLADVA